mmetsp:Transcript_728/g.2434  ORF Transcript_728/g.2434 Transcript_728/m.2434 type:complete len:233 (+) Transcript_728:218-916(+)
MTFSILYLSFKFTIGSCSGSDSVLPGLLSGSGSALPDLLSDSDSGFAQQGLPHMPELQISGFVGFVRTLLRQTDQRGIVPVRLQMRKILQKHHTRMLSVQLVQPGLLSGFVQIVQKGLPHMPEPRISGFVGFVHIERQRMRIVPELLFLLQLDLQRWSMQMRICLLKIVLVHCFRMHLPEHQISGSARIEQIVPVLLLQQWRWSMPEMMRIYLLQIALVPGFQLQPIDFEQS